MDHRDRDDQLPRHVAQDRVCGCEGRVAEHPVRKILFNDVRLLGDRHEGWPRGSRLGGGIHRIDVASWQSPDTGGSEAALTLEEEHSPGDRVGGLNDATGHSFEHALDRLGDRHVGCHLRQGGCGTPQPVGFRDIPKDDRHDWAPPSLNQGMRHVQLANVTIRTHRPCPELAGAAESDVSEVGPEPRTVLWKNVGQEIGADNGFR